MIPDDEPPSTPAPWIIRSVVPALVLLAVGVGLYFWAQSYNATARRFPTMVAGALVVFSLIDAWCRTGWPGSRFMTAFWGAEFNNREMQHNPRARDEVTMILWVIGCVVGMAVAGFLPAIPVFVAGFVWIRAARPLRDALLAGFAAFAFVYGVFELALDFRLYRGLFLAPGGFGSW